ncbi:hypothetical protein HDU96_010701 [Phlyctochytrium bullatum]|nr:hypothetical protein HDU96_010701 [Phlyctochytrium bullatum]
MSTIECRPTEDAPKLFDQEVKDYGCDLGETPWDDAAVEAWEEDKEKPVLGLPYTADVSSSIDNRILTFSDDGACGSNAGEESSDQEMPVATVEGGPPSEENAASECRALPRESSELPAPNAPPSPSETDRNPALSGPIIITPLSQHIPDPPRQPPDPPSTASSLQAQPRSPPPTAAELPAKPVVEASPNPIPVSAPPPPEEKPLTEVEKACLPLLKRRSTLSASLVHTLAEELGRRWLGTLTVSPAPPSRSVTSADGDHSTGVSLSLADYDVTGIAMISTPTAKPAEQPGGAPASDSKVLNASAMMGVIAKGLGVPSNRAPVAATTVAVTSMAASNPSPQPQPYPQPLLQGYHRAPFHHVGHALHAAAYAATQRASDASPIPSLVGASFGTDTSPSPHPAAATRNSHANQSPAPPASPPLCFAQSYHQHRANLATIGAVTGKGTRNRGSSASSAASATTSVHLVPMQHYPYMRNLPPSIPNVRRGERPRQYMAPAGVAGQAVTGVAETGKKEKKRRKRRSKKAGSGEAAAVEEKASAEKQEKKKEMDYVNQAGASDALTPTHLNANSIGGRAAELLPPTILNKPPPPTPSTPSLPSLLPSFRRDPTTTAHSQRPPLVLRTSRPNEDAPYPDPWDEEPLRQPPTVAVAESTGLVVLTASRSASPCLPQIVPKKRNPTGPSVRRQTAGTRLTSAGGASGDAHELPPTGPSDKHRTVSLPALSLAADPVPAELSSPDQTSPTSPATASVSGSGESYLTPSSATSSRSSRKHRTAHPIVSASLTAPTQACATRRLPPHSMTTAAGLYRMRNAHRRRTEQRDRDDGFASATGGNNFARGDGGTARRQQKQKPEKVSPRTPGVVPGLLPKLVPPPAVPAQRTSTRWVLMMKRQGEKVEAAKARVVEDRDDAGTTVADWEALERTGGVAKSQVATGTTDKGSSSQTQVVSEPSTPTTLAATETPLQALPPPTTITQTPAGLLPTLPAPPARRPAQAVAKVKRIPHPATHASGSQISTWTLYRTLYGGPPPSPFMASRDATISDASGTPPLNRLQFVAPRRHRVGRSPASVSGGGTGGAGGVLPPIIDRSDAFLSLGPPPRKSGVALGMAAYRAAAALAEKGLKEPAGGKAAADFTGRSGRGAGGQRLKPLMLLGAIDGEFYAMDPKDMIRQVKLKQAVTECKLDAALVALREAEFIVPTLLAKEKYLSRSKASTRSTNDGSDSDVYVDSSDSDDKSLDTCHICGKSEGAELMVCSNERSMAKAPARDKNAANGGGMVTRSSKKTEQEPDSPVSLSTTTSAAEKAEESANSLCLHVAAEHALSGKDGIGTLQRKMMIGNAVTARAASKLKAVYEDEEYEDENAGDNSDDYCAICAADGKHIQQQLDGNPSWRSRPVVLSLFDGIGAAYVALRRLGVRPAAYLSSEIDQVACEVLDTYAASHGGNVVQVGDVMQFMPQRDLPRLLKGVVRNEQLEAWKNQANSNAEPVVDLLIGGSPCTDLSFLGQGAGLVEGKQSSFFFEYVRVLKETKPRWFLFENVRMRNQEMDIISKELGVKPIVVVERLMGFPDFYTEVEPVRKRRHALLGNSFSVYSVAHILESLFKGDEKAPELEWKSASEQAVYAGEPQPSILPAGITSDSASISKLDGELWAMQPLSPPQDKPPRLTIGQRDKIRRVLRWLDRFAQNLPLQEVPGSETMPGWLVPDYNHRHVMLINDALPGSPPSWSMVLLVPPSEKDKTMLPANSIRKYSKTVSLPPPDETWPEDAPAEVAQSPTAVTVRYFSTGAYWCIETWRRIPDSTGWASNIRLIDPRAPEQDDAVRTMEACFPGWTSRRDVKIALEVAAGGKMPVEMRWAKWSKRAEGGAIGQDLTRIVQGPGSSRWSQPGGSKAAGSSSESADPEAYGAIATRTRSKPTKPTSSARPTPKIESINPLPSTAPSRSVPTLSSSIPTLVSITQRLKRSIPELGEVTVDGLNQHALSRVPDGGYICMEEVEKDLRAAVEALEKVEKHVTGKEEDEIEHEGVREVFEREWSNNEELWLEEGGLVFVVPHRFMKTKDSQIWWPGMIVPLEEIDNSLPARATAPGSYVVRYFEDNTCSVVNFRALEPFDPHNQDPTTGRFAALKQRFGEQAIRSNPAIRKAMRYACTGMVPAKFPWALWGCSGLYWTGPPEIEEAGKRKAEDEGIGGPEKRSRVEVIGIEVVKLKGPRTLCNDCGLKLYLETVPRVPVSELSNERFIENQDKTKNNSEHRYYTTRRTLPFHVWDNLGGGMLDGNFKLKEAFVSQGVVPERLPEPIAEHLIMQKETRYAD